MNNLQEMKDSALEVITATIEELQFSIEDYKKDQTEPNWIYVEICKRQVDSTIYAYRWVDLIDGMSYDLYHRYATELVRNAAEL